MELDSSPIKSTKRVLEEMKLPVARKVEKAHDFELTDSIMGHTVEGIVGGAVQSYRLKKANENDVLCIVQFFYCTVVVLYSTFSVQYFYCIVLSLYSTCIFQYLYCT
jgi:hypothetical protein